MAFYKQVVNDFVPVAGSTISIPPFDDNLCCVFVSPQTAIIGTVNIQLPAGCMHGQAVRIFFSKAISILNITALSGTLVGALTSALLGSSVVYAYNASTNEWWKG